MGVPGSRVGKCGGLQGLLQVGWVGVALRERWSCSCPSNLFLGSRPAGHTAADCRNGSVLHATNLAHTVQAAEYTWFTCTAKVLVWNHMHHDVVGGLGSGLHRYWVS